MEAVCGVFPGAEATVEELTAHNACMVHELALHVERLTPGAEFVAALPFVVLFIIFGIGYRLGLGF